jgi:hypothetical protein
LWVAVKKYKRVVIHVLARLASTFVSQRRAQRDPQAPQVTLSPQWVRRVFKGWNFTWKVPVRCQIAKFSPHNIRFYIHYTIAVSQLPRHRLKFMDEAHLDHRSTLFFLPWPAFLPFCPRPLLSFLFFHFSSIEFIFASFALAFLPIFFSVSFLLQIFSEVACFPLAVNVLSP